MLSEQTRHIGPGSLAALGGLVARLNPQRTMLVTGATSYHRSGAADLIEPALARWQVTRLNEVSSNPTISVVERGISIWRRDRPCVIIAAGGGSVIDVAKLIGVLAPDMAAWNSIPDERSFTGAVPVIAIPTTAGSGAEATRFATFYVDGEKYSISHPMLRPRHAIIDPLLTASLPPSVAAATGFDAFAQAIESLWAVGATDQSQALAEAALREMLPCLSDIVRAPRPEARARMAHGAYLAGQAIDISRTTAAHALSYALTADLGVPHGHAVGLLLPSIFRINAAPGGRAIRDPRGGAYVEAAIARILRLLGCQNGEQAARLLEQQMHTLGLATQLTGNGCGVTAASLAAKVNAERLNNNPVALSNADIVAIYAGVIGGAMPP